MNKSLSPLTWVSLVVMAIAAAACMPAVKTGQPVSNAPAAAESLTSETTTDPFLYCASVGKIDQPDARYTGPKIDDRVIKGFIKAAGLNPDSAPSDIYKQATIWRCMDSKVYACNFGANLPCESKANTEKNPTLEIADYCKANPDSEFIPMAVTGRETIYSWHCVKGLPEILDQIDQVDAAGYLQRIWYLVEP